MFFDRIFAVISAAAFALGVVVHLGWLTGDAPASLRDELTILFFAVAILPFVYVVVHAGRRDGFPYDIQGALELMPVIRTLPRWAKVVSFGLLIYVAALFALALAPAIPGIAPQSCASPGNESGACIAWETLVAALIATFTASSFVDAVYLLRTKRRAPDTSA